MKCFILTTEPDKNGIIRLDGDDYHYLIRVRRLVPGDIFPAALQAGDKVMIQIISVEGRIVTGKCMPEGKPDSGELSTVHPQLNLPPIILFQALPKGEKMDLIVRQAAEIGIAEIFPFTSEFSVPKIKAKESKHSVKFSRWQRIIREARQQSGSSAATVVHEPMSCDELFNRWDDFNTKYSGALGLLFHQTPLENASIHGYLDKRPALLVLAIGPEGGFSNTELSRFLEAGFKPFTIGGTLNEAEGQSFQSTVLRTETAALYAAAAVQIILLESNSWEMKRSR